ncbi:MAG: hypothetical protein KatS3mg109_1300 [Pirellulaceae bacterium]|nr:MAG: hypothetical protein KatS3mg109_1300 [Pirellulaceae bacterium]
MRRSNGRRAALTLLELIIASTLLTLLMTSVATLLRTSRLAWQVQQEDAARMESAYGALRHVVRWVRQAESLVAASDASNNSGYLTIQLPNKERFAWRHDPSSAQLLFGKGTADQLLAEKIEGFTVETFRADGVTPTSDPDQVQCLRISIRVRLPGEKNRPHTVRSWVMMRAW